MKLSDEILYQHAGEARDLWLLSTLPMESDIPVHLFSSKFNRKMKGLIRAQRRTPRINQIIFYGGKAIAAILIIACLSFAGLMSVEAYREKFIHMITRVFTDLTEYKFASNTPYQDASFPPVNFGYIPEGMTEVQHDDFETARYILYEAADGSFFSIDQFLITENGGGTMILNTENALVETLYIQGNEATLVCKGGQNGILWTAGNVVNHLSGTILAEEIIKIAQEIK